LVMQDGWYALVIGIGKVGTLPKLDGARNDAKRFADWAEHQGYAVTRLIDEDNAPVDVKQIRTALSDILEDDVTRLLIFFAGHGVALPEGDYWLCSGFMDDGDECINEALTTRTATEHAIGQISIIVDACRTTQAEAQRANGRNLFKSPASMPAQEPRIDILYATRPGRAAQEVKSGKPELAFGVFSNCLLDALSGKNAELFDGSRTPPQLTSASLANWLEKEVPLVSGKIKDAEVQRPSTVTGWRKPDDWYLAKTTDPDQDEPRFNANFGGGPRATPIVLDSDDAPAAPSPQIDTPDDKVPVSRVTDLLSETAANTQRVQDDIKAAEGRASFETRQGISVIGAIAQYVASRPGINKPDLFPESGIWNVRCFRGPEPLAIELADGRWIGTANLQGFVGTHLVDDKSVLGLNYAPSGGGDGWDAPVDAAARWMALIASGERADQAELTQFARYVRQGKHTNPSLGILAAYAYDLARIGSGDGEDSAQSVADWHASMDGFVPFDVAMLARKRDWPGATIAGGFPLMTRGWALLEVYPRPINDELLKLRAGLLPGPWTCFRAEEGKRLAQLIEEGKL
jgi:hypothetical protein